MKRLFFYAMVAVLAISAGAFTVTASAPQNSGALEIGKLWGKVSEMEGKDKPQSEAGYLREIMSLSGRDGDCVNLLKAMGKLVGCVRSYDRMESGKLYDEFRAYSPVFATPAQKSAFLAFIAGNYYGISDFYDVGSYGGYISSALDTVMSLKNELLAEHADYVLIDLFFNESEDDRRLFPCFSQYEALMRFFYGISNSYQVRGTGIRERVLEGLEESSEGHPSSEIYTACINLEKEASPDDRVLLAGYGTILERYPGEPSGVLPASRKAALLLRLAERENPQKEESYLGVRKWCDESVAKYGASEYRRRILNVIKSMESKRMDVETDDFTYPGDSIRCSVGYRNIDKIVLTLYGLKDYLTPGFYESGGDAFAGGIVGKPVVRRKVLDGIGRGYGVDAKDRYAIAGVSPGNYLLVAVPYSGGVALPDGQKESKYIKVSRIATAFRFTAGNGMELYPADYKTGKPLKEGALVFFRPIASEAGGYGGFEPISEKRLGFDGFTETAVCPADARGKSGTCFNVESGNDRNSPIANVGRIWRCESGDGTLSPGGEVYTDRMLYKPEDTVMFSVVSYLSDGREGSVRDGVVFDARLFGPGGVKPLTEMKLTTDGMGTASGRFGIPKGSMNGLYRIVCDEGIGYAYFRVESYSHPTFKVEMPKVDGICSFGAGVTQNGEVVSYSGFPIVGAEVSYEVWMVPVMRKYGYFRFDSRKLASGMVKSDDDGRFSIKFTAVSSQHRFARYRVVVTVKDSQGETHSAEASVSVGDVPIDLSDGFEACPDFGGYRVVNKDKPVPLIIYVRNLDGMAWPSSGDYTITPVKAENGGAGSVPGAAMEGKFTQGEPVGTGYAALPSGGYELKYTVQCNGRGISQSSRLLLLSASDTVCPVDTELFFCPLVTKDGIEFLVGTTENDLWLECELFDNCNRLFRKPMHLRNSMAKVSLPYEASYPNSVSLSLSAFRNLEFFHKEYGFERVEKHPLKVEIESFRDLSVPGSDECFTMHVFDSKTGETPLTSSTVSIFDVTTDRFGANRFQFHPFGTRNSRAPIIRTNIPCNMILRGCAMGVKSMENADMSGTNVLEKEAVSEESGPEPDSCMRSDFGETVAFYPRLRSDTNGIVRVGYRTSDAFSEYRVLVSSHTADLRSGSADTSFVIRKELMVVPNMPVFVREGDRIVLKAEVVNLGRKEVDGTASLVLYDASSGKENRVAGINTPERHVSVAAYGRKEISWIVDVPGKPLLLGVRMSVNAGGLADGEQRVIPVIPSGTQVTESVSVVMQGRKSYTIDLGELMDRPSTGDEKVILDISSPLSSVIESLPAVGEPDFDCMTSWLSSLFINQTGEYMFGKYPALAERVRKLTNGGWSGSRISVNSEITGILLDETPWACTEALDNRRIAALSNYLKPGHASEFREKADRKLSELQQSDGGFAWFRGAASSESLTLMFLEKFHEMIRIGALELNDTERGMVLNACRFLDEGMRRRYDGYLEDCLKAGNKPDSGIIHGGTLKTEAVRSEYPDIEMPESARKAYGFYFDCIFRNWKGTDISDKAAVTALLTRVSEGSDMVPAALYDCDGELRKVIESLNDHVVWDSSGACHFPNAVMRSTGIMDNELYAHSQLLSLYDGLSAKFGASSSVADRALGMRLSGIVRGLGLWIMLQKHNRSWGNDLAATDAVYALLSSGVGGVDSFASGCGFEILAPKISVAEPEGGTLFRYEVPVHDLRAGGCKIRIRNDGDGLLLASAYRSYTQPIRSVAASSNGISMERRFYRRGAVEAAAWGDTADSVEIRDGDKVNVGEMVEEICRIRSDMTRSFVHLCLPRPSCFYPVDEKSGYEWRSGCYRENRKSMADYFFYILSEGVTEIRESFYVTQEGTFSTSPANIQSLYAPEYRGKVPAFSVCTE
ncbi:MAG: hypothetical protein LKK19_02900 [Bacteroidales bacterium]|jgi:hypothetical protein|nr:hypothetical protein [Bacteroidales bacterium]MCI2121634.1 hypothetical protein [Bacteroidales bacterium]MCI2146278.1 hypothetical protein [Bacteroidales bacterium]